MSWRTACRVGCCSRPPCDGRDGAILRFGSCAASDACGVGEGRVAAELDCCPTSETPLQRHKMSTFWAKRYVFAIMIVSAFSMRYWLLIEEF